MAELDTLPKLLLNNGKSRSEKPAIREKNLGIWQTYTWSDYLQNVREFALGLKAHGFGPGDKLCVAGTNLPRLYWAEMAAISLGGTAVPVYADAIANELKFVLNNAEVKVIVCEDQEQVDKILAIRGDLPTVDLIVYDDPRGLAGNGDPSIRGFEEIQEEGRGQDQSAFEAAANAVTPDDIAFMCYTSGTTGNPKGVMLSHRNLVSAANIFLDNELVRETDDLFSYLPLAWVGEALYSTTVSIAAGCATNCPEQPETFRRDGRELGATGLVAAPRNFEMILSEIQVKANDAPPLKKWIFNTFKDAAVEIENLRAEKKPVPFGLKFKKALGEVLVYGPVRDQYGFRRARWCYVGGAPLGPDTFRFFRAFGINLKQLYGSTEACGTVSLQKDNEASPDNVGRPCSGIEVKIADNGEVLVRSPAVFVGYYKNDQATEEAKDAEGWLRTGDAGIVESSGELIIIDRAKDVGKLVDGSPFAPQFVENKLKFSPYISEAVSFGHEKPFVCAMIAIDYNTVGNWAEKQGIAYSNYMDLSQKQEVRDLIREEINRINPSLPEVSRIKRFLLLAKDLDADDAEVTRTRKLRRGYIAEHYAPVIEAFYGGASEVDLETEVTYEDGRKATMEAHLTIQEAA
ncbi:MAG: AMP-dependent synthetase/ligase [Minwuia sp.]|uniref:AMP-dependent synthetase/ligase n=1 Tax=Minwuia sp. TaxID=2493630 RepID=UPI003A8806EC